MTAHLQRRGSLPGPFSGAEYSLLEPASDQRSRDGGSERCTTSKPSAHATVPDSLPGSTRSRPAAGVSTYSVAAASSIIIPTPIRGITVTIRLLVSAIRVGSASMRSTILRETSSRCRATRCGLPSSAWEAAIPVAPSKCRPSRLESHAIIQSRTISTTMPCPTSATDSASAGSAGFGKHSLAPGFDRRIPSHSDNRRFASRPGPILFLLDSRARLLVLVDDLLLDVRWHGFVAAQFHRK